MLKKKIIFYGIYPFFIVYSILLDKMTEQFRSPISEPFADSSLSKKIIKIATKCNF